jgi:phosphate butyryltransferase
MLKTLKDVEELARGKGRKRLAVGAAESKSLVEGLKMAEHLVEPILIGDASMIQPFLDEVGLSAQVVSARDPIEAARTSIEMVRTDEADLVMKGKLGTPEFLRLILDRERGLRTGNILSHIALTEVPGYHKLIFVTDAGMNTHPDFQTKAKILKNCLAIMRTMGYERPKVAVIASIETVHPDLPATTDAAILSKMAERGAFGDALVEGPLGFDLAFSEDSKRVKGIDSEVCADADVLLVPDVTTGNIMSKAMIYFGGATVGGLIVGAQVPIALLSRADTPERKLYSIAFSIAAM